MLPNPSTFEITKRSPRPYKSLVAPVGVAAGRGIAFIEDPANPGKAIVADGSLNIAGFVTRPVKVGGPTIEDAVLPNRIELPFEDGKEISLEHAEEVEAEGYGVGLYSGTGAKTLAGDTAIGTECSFQGGRFSIAATGDTAEYYLAEIKAAVDAANTFRARFVLIQGQVK
jgi:hypothetical protein